MGPYDRYKWELFHPSYDPYKWSYYHPTYNWFAGPLTLYASRQANLAAGDAEKAVPMASEARRVEGDEVMNYSSSHTSWESVEAFFGPWKMIFGLEEEVSKDSG